MIKEFHTYIPHMRMWVVRREQDVEPYLELNQYKQANEPGKFDKARLKRGYREIAEIPNIVVEQWLKEGINVFDPSPEMKKKVRAKLRSPEYRKLRTVGAI